MNLRTYVFQKSQQIKLGFQGKQPTIGMFSEKVISVNITQKKRDEFIFVDFSTATLFDSWN